MSYATEAAEFEQNIQERSTDSPGLSTGFSENFFQGVGQTVDNNLSISEWIVRETGGWSLTDRNEELNELRKNGLLTDDEFSSFRETDSRGMPTINYSKLAEYANNMLAIEKPGIHIETDEEINGRMREGLKRRRERAQDISDRQTTGGFTGNITGSLIGFSLEPAGIAAIPLEGVMIGRSAYVLSQATTRLGRASRVAGISATANMATEAAIQPIMFNWAEQLGTEMTWGDALMNIASVGVMSGAITGVANAAVTKKSFKGQQLAAQINEGVKKADLSSTSKPKNQEELIDERTRLQETLTTDDVKTVLQTLRGQTKNIVKDEEATNLLKQVEDELSTVPNINARDHFEKMDATEKRVNEYTAPTKQREEIETEIEDAQLEADFSQALESSPTLKNMKIDDVFENMDSKMFNKAIDVVNDTQRRKKIMDTCLLGKGAV